MTNRIRIAIAQLNPVVGDVEGNIEKAREARREAFEADLILFPELFVVGYPPEDLVLKTSLQSRVKAALHAFALETNDGGPAVMIGAPWQEEDSLYNAVVLLEGGEIKAKTFKHDLPNYGVFDEKRVFTSGPLPKPITVAGVRIGVAICEDLWTKKVVGELARHEPDIILVSNASPFEVGKDFTRLQVVKERVSESQKPILYLNQVGGQDELVFDGGSFIVNKNQELAIRLPSWQDKIITTSWNKEDNGWFCEASDKAVIEDRTTSIYQALVLGLRDYVNKNGFNGVVLGLSGGIDSALSACIAVDALGKDRVWAIMMPSRFTSEESLNDARECAALLNISYEVLSIEPAFVTLLDTFSSLFVGQKENITEENIQSRIRGLMLMAFSNKFGPMVLTTGNKSEMSVGYATLYGDMCGGFNALKDVYKTEVFELARFRNRHRPSGALGPVGRVIPPNCITKAPSAELKSHQRDQDTLPPYEVLDPILRSLIEDDIPVPDLINQGFDRETVKSIERMIYLSEYKRKQSAPGVKISSRNFGRDRRYPITNSFRDAP